MTALLIVAVSAVLYGFVRASHAVMDAMTRVCRQGIRVRLRF